MNPASSTHTADSPAITNGPLRTEMPPARPGPARPRRSTVFYGIVGAVVLGVGLLGAVLFVPGFRMRQHYTGPTALVKRDILRVTIIERGALESAENNDIVVRVKSGAKGSASSSNIKWVVDDGTIVKAGDKLAEFDDSGFQDQLKTKRNEVNKAYAEWATAANESAVQESQNVSDIKTAEVKLIQAEIELKKYSGELAAAKLIKMETQDEIRRYLREHFDDDCHKESMRMGGKSSSAYLQDISVYEGVIETARSDKETWVDRAAWSQRMFKKGFYSLSQADADQSRLQSTEISLRKAEGDRDLYRLYEREKNITIKWSDVKEAERAFKRVDIQAKSKMKKNLADESAKKSIYDQELDRLHDLERDEKFYTIYSPQNGMVVYFVAEQARFGSGSQQATVAQGEPVREGQKLMRIPNLQKMLVNVRVHEAMIAKVFGEMAKPTGFGEALRLGSSLGRTDMFGLASYYQAYEEKRELFRDKEWHVLYPGQKAKVRVEAFAGEIYNGHVKSKASVASQADFLSSDVKVYQTMVAIDEVGSKRLQPGMSAEVTILADATPEPVLLIPLQSVVGNVAMGAHRKVFVVDASDNTQERDIVVGKSNDKFVEVISGLEENEKVVLNPRLLLPEKTDLKAGTPSMRHGGDFDQGGGKKKGGGKKGGKAFNGPPGMPPGVPAGVGKK